MTEEELNIIFHINCHYFMNKYHIDSSKTMFGLMNKKELAHYMKEFAIDKEPYKADFANKKILYALFGISYATEKGEMIVRFLDRIELHCILFFLERWYEERPNFFELVVIH